MVAEVSKRMRIEEEKLERVAYVLKTVAHPVRINIIDLLDQEGPMTVTAIQESLQIEQSLTSHHLKSLRDKGIIDAKRNGRHIYYELADRKVVKILDCIQECKFC